MTDDKIISIKQEIQTDGALAHIKNELDERALSLGMLSKDSPAYKPNEKRLNEVAIQQADLEQQIEKLEAK